MGKRWSGLLDRLPMLLRRRSIASDRPEFLWLPSELGKINCVWPVGGLRFLVSPLLTFLSCCHPPRLVCCFASILDSYLSPLLSAQGFSFRTHYYSRELPLCGVSPQYPYYSVRSMRVLYRRCPSVFLSLLHCELRNS